MGKPKKMIKVGALVEFDELRGLVKQAVSKPSYLIECLDGKEIFVAASDVKELSAAEQIAFWRDRALLAEGKTPADTEATLKISVPGDDENPYTAHCTECDFTQHFPDEADAASDMMKAGWRFEGGSTICPKH